MKRTGLRGEGLVEEYFICKKIPNIMGLSYVPETPNIMGLFYVPEIPNIMGLFYVPETPNIMGLFYVPRSLTLWVFLMYRVPKRGFLMYSPPTVHKMDPYKEDNKLFP